ncbi:MAG: hypothetical protein WAN43_01425 [Rhodomicrobium sp.]
MGDFEAGGIELQNPVANDGRLGQALACAGVMNDFAIFPIYDQIMLDCRRVEISAKLDGEILPFGGRRKNFDDDNWVWRNNIPKPHGACKDNDVGLECRFRAGFYNNAVDADKQLETRLGDRAVQRLSDAKLEMSVAPCLRLLQRRDPLEQFPVLFGLRLSPNRKLFGRHRSLRKRCVHDDENSIRGVEPQWREQVLAERAKVSRELQFNSVAEKGIALLQPRRRMRWLRECPRL